MSLLFKFLMASVSTLINLMCVLIVMLTKELRRIEFFLVFCQTLHDFINVGLFSAILTGFETVDQFFDVCNDRISMALQYPFR